ncbi:MULTISPECIES: hypothetical protein [unclassified Streptomyces]|uniref:hypothetical protein n=1 Tax=Streptomyces TaxID=1883 RepID=UPI0013E2960F|nr:MULTISPECIES: hypothetical protein [unclassified Streptomyces]UQA38373.1 hypothetical protein KRR37_18580 [Streptomyces sp. HNA39]
MGNTGPGSAGNGGPGRGELSGYGMIPLLGGVGMAAWGVYRVREAGGVRGR